MKSAALAQITHSRTYMISISGDPVAFLSGKMKPCMFGFQYLFSSYQD